MRLLRSPHQTRELRAPRAAAGCGRGAVPVPVLSEERSPSLLETRAFRYGGKTAVPAAPAQRRGSPGASMCERS